MPGVDCNLNNDYPPPYLRMETDPVSEALCSSEYFVMPQSQFYILFVKWAYVVLCLQYCDKKVGVHFVAGNHVTLLDNKDCATIINRQVVDNEATAFKNSIMADDSK
jgi:hypothetical protein